MTGRRFFPGEQEVGCVSNHLQACSWSNSFSLSDFHLLSFTNETVHGLSLSENRHAHTSFNSVELSASHSFTQSCFQHHQSHLQHACSLTKNDVHTFFHRKTHQITHACRLQALSNTKTTNQHNQRLSESKVFIKVWDALRVPLQIWHSFQKPEILWKPNNKWGLVQDWDLERVCAAWCRRPVGEAPTTPLPQL